MINGRKSLLHYVDSTTIFGESVLHCEDSSI